MVSFAKSLRPRARKADSNARESETDDGADARYRELKIGRGWDDADHDLEPLAGVLKRRVTALEKQIAALTVALATRVTPLFIKRSARALRARAGHF